ncbi:hypothetical protein GCM10011316_02970 [Roseibium aquae]|uniref:Uncharacterized protein n=1 Tax=Roseibium aquae TaxID=1323746 RepID=A0A916T788_9HYPH|nr:hypothetical protein [Roseibium aquae]GGB34282.1 hypothetical protein GCM10011316_02970 [Roseibium aquae]
MFVELIATLIAGLAGAGLVMLANLMIGRRLPRWFAPVGAGAAMLATTISSEYGWYARTTETLPEGLIVAETVENRALYRPWTYVKPFVERFVAVDTVTLRNHPDQPGLKLADVYFFGRWAPVHKLPVLADCPGSRRAALADGISFGTSGQIEGADWIQVPPADPVVRTICGAG